MTDYVYRRQAYKAARQKVREAMIHRRLDQAAIIDIAQGVIDSDYPGAKVDISDLVGACLYYQQGMPMHQVDEG